LEAAWHAAVGIDTTTTQIVSSFIFSPPYTGNGDHHDLVPAALAFTPDGAGRYAIGVDIYGAPGVIEGETGILWTPAGKLTLSDLPSDIAIAEVPHACAPPAVTPTCAGDCNGDGVTTVDEVVRGVAIALGDKPLSSCPASDPNHDGIVAVSDLVQAVKSVLQGCGP
jgi:hypothetical protein